MNQTNEVMQVVAGIIGLLLIAAIVHGITYRVRLPYTIVLLLVGIGLHSLASTYPQLLPAWHDLEISPGLILFVFLPSLIFESAFNLDARQLRENLGPVLMLAIPGLLLSTLVIGVIVHAAASIPFPAALLLGAILSATDPVAVIAVFKRLGAPLRLRTVVEGESLFNDATSLVVARLILAVVVGGSLSASTVAKGALSFVAVFVGGLLAGWALGRLAGYALGRVQDNFIEITLTTVLAYASFLLAERVFHVSGIMAAIAAGLAIGGRGRMKVSAPVRTYLEHFWEYLAFIANALIFLMVGLRVDLRALWGSGALVVWTVLALLVSRALVVYGLVPLAGRLPGSRQVDRAYQTVIYWGGLRGAIALAIVLSLPRFEQRESFIAVVMGAVLFTLLVNGLTMEPLVRYLGLHRPLLADRLVLMEGDFAANRRALELLPDLLASGRVSGTVAIRLQEEFEKRVQAVKADIETLHSDELKDDDTQTSLLYLRGLAEERSLYVSMFDKGQLGERAFGQLALSLERQIDAIRDSGEYMDLRPRDRRHRLEELVLGVLTRMPNLAPLAERLQMTHVATDYQISSARYLGSQRVLNVLDDLARLESTPWYIADRMRRQYRQKSQDARHEADQIAERCPEFIIDLQERSGRKLLLMAKTESIAHQLESGTLTPEVAKRLRDEIRQEVRALRPYRSGRLKLGPGDLLRRWPPFQNLSADEVAYLAIRLRLQLAEEGQIILNQGQEADAMFFIARGVVRLTRENNGASRDIATLMAGDFFGETALLPGEPYIDAATAVTPCSLYRLERVDLEVAMANDPIVRRALEKLEGERAAGRDNRG